MAEKGWIHVFAFQDNALSAETIGRAAMQDGFLTNEKIADTQITATKFASGTVLATGVYGTSTYGACYYA